MEGVTGRRSSRAAIAGVKVLLQEVNEPLQVAQGTTRLAGAPLAQQVHSQLGRALVGGGGLLGHQMLNDVGRMTP